MPPPRVGRRRIGARTHAKHTPEGLRRLPPDCGCRCAVEDSAAARRSCTLELRDALAAPLDRRLLQFYTNATAVDAAPTLLNNASGRGAGEQPGMVKSCAEACTSFANVSCFVLHRREHSAVQLHRCIPPSAAAVAADQA